MNKKIKNISKFLIAGTFAALVVAITFSVITPKKVSAACSQANAVYGTDTMNMPIPGDSTYSVWVRLKGSTSANNGAFLQIDGTSCYNVGGNPNLVADTWTWVNFQNGDATQLMKLPLTAGNHTFELFGIKPGVSIDNILALNDPNCVPVDTGTNCTTTSSITLPNPPTNLASNTVSTTEVDLNWTASTMPTGATASVVGYNVFRQGVQISPANTPVTSTTFQDKALSPGTSYTYTVQAVDSASPANLSTQSNATTSSTYSIPTTPQPIASAVNSNLINLSWTQSIDAIGPGIGSYLVTRNDGFKVTVNAPALTFADNTVLSGTTYSYTVQASDLAGNLSPISSSVSATTPKPVDNIAPSVPVASIGSSLYNSVTINWTASVDNLGGSGLASYTLFRDGVAIYTASYNVTTYTDTSVSPATSYSYSVLATDNNGNASLQSKATATITPAKPLVNPTTPTNVIATAANPSTVGISWTASTDVGGPGVAGYYILRKNITAKDTIATTIGQTTLTTYTDTSALSSTTYSYQVQAYDTSTPQNLSSPSTESTPSTATTPAKPSPPAQPTGLVAASYSSSQINLSWTLSTDAVSYSVYRVGTTSAIAANITTASFGVTNLSAATSYTFYIVAVNATGTSPNSLNVSAATQAATTTVTLTGIVTDNATGLPLVGASVKTGKASAATGAVSTTTNSAGQYTLTGIYPNKQHYYYFSATNYKQLSIYVSYPVGTYTLNEKLIHN